MAKSKSGSNAFSFASGWCGAEKGNLIFHQHWPDAQCEGDTIPGGKGEKICGEEGSLFKVSEQPSKCK